MKNLTLTIQEIADLKEGRKSLSEIQKCHVSLKQVRTAITPVIEGFLRNVNYGERIEDWTEDDFQAEMEWYIDKIARFYRDNATKKEFCDSLRGNLDILGISECGKFGVFLISKPLSVSTMALAIDWLKSARERLRRFFI